MPEGSSFDSNILLSVGPLLEISYNARPYWECVGPLVGLQGRHGGAAERESGSKGRKRSELHVTIVLSFRNLLYLCNKCRRSSPGVDSKQLTVVQPVKIFLVRMSAYGNLSHVRKFGRILQVFGGDRHAR